MRIDKDGNPLSAMGEQLEYSKELGWIEALEWAWNQGIYPDDVYDAVKAKLKELKDE